MYFPSLTRQRKQFIQFIFHCLLENAVLLLICQRYGKFEPLPKRLWYARYTTRKRQDYVFDKGKHSACHK